MRERELVDEGAALFGGEQGSQESRVKGREPNKKLRRQVETVEPSPGPSLQGRGIGDQSTSLALIQLISLRSLRPTTSTGWFLSFSLHGFEVLAAALGFGDPFFGECAVLDFFEDLLHLGFLVSAVMIRGPRV